MAVGAQPLARRGGATPSSFSALATVADSELHRQDSYWSRFVRRSRRFTFRLAHLLDSGDYLVAISREQGLASASNAPECQSACSPPREKPGGLREKPGDLPACAPTSVGVDGPLATTGAAPPHATAAAPDHYANGPGAPARHHADGGLR